jgi:hypothetical protein
MIDLMVGAWSSGFMTAVNMVRRVNHDDTRNLAAIELDEQVITIRRYCKQHATNQVMDGVMELFDSLTSNADGK